MHMDGNNLVTQSTYNLGNNFGWVNYLLWCKEAISINVEIMFQCFEMNLCGWIVILHFTFV